MKVTQYLVWPKDMGTPSYYGGLHIRCRTHPSKVVSFSKRGPDGVTEMRK